MNLRSYLRGIGAGLIVAALVLGFNKRTKINDEYVKRRAAELGMTESSVLTDKNKTDVSAAEEIVSSVKAPGNTDSGNAVSGNDISASDDLSENPILEPDKVTVPPILPGEDKDADNSNSSKEDKPGNASENNSGNSEDPEEISSHSINPLPENEKGFVQGEDGATITVIRGDSSVSVARRLYEAGLVESAVEFDKYLCDNGYDKVISVGTYDIHYGMDFADIAKLITRRN
jgi:hypothetical protein